MSDRIFTISTGRSGTAWLADFFKENLKPDIEADVYHEGNLYLEFGTFRPGIRHLHEYNFIGNTERVRNFWKQKFSSDKYSDDKPAVETSHINAKAGLIENLDLLQEHEVTIIHLKRDPVKTALSFQKRYDFANIGNKWIWYLDPEYKRNVVPYEHFKSLNYHGQLAWYICEMRARAKVLSDHYLKDKHRYLEVDLEEITTPTGAKDLVQHFGFLKQEDVVIPEKINTTQSNQIGEKDKQQLSYIISKLEEKGILLS